MEILIKCSNCKNCITIKEQKDLNEKFIISTQIEANNRKNPKEVEYKLTSFKVTCSECEKDSIEFLYVPLTKSIVYTDGE